ncbi:MAG: (d)CMP kinase [Candidatus Scalindua sp. AMX11]|nr:MAG: (d)CMP kinase [Candidatus Scalindua sp.]NOG83306.1 (d)CMP kinase [Planctomycetota bacterium]RZV76794.1 MAG: (d)CMP kinase [Candidatus Scalindua sp. SCAELEC01]TDE63451.1 MAG: (d)CMP kinase [Candidatus Scalindua sp. AMX11]GJQ57478.1 MAG: cytidylate kinase [Candidatus Scalindua sp.]
MVVVIDGPAGSGKSTIAKMLAERLSIKYLDSGAMYRALTWKAAKKGVDFHDDEGLCKLLSATCIRIENTKNGFETYVDDVNVTREIRLPFVTKNVHYVSNIEFVREKMVEHQRRFAEGENIIAEGRDMASVVFPDADKKIYLDADITVRGERRHSELGNLNGPSQLLTVVEDLKQRDHKDMTRGLAPLKQVDDAFYLDTTRLTIEEVVAILIEEIGQISK